MIQEGVDYFRLDQNADQLRDIYRSVVDCCVDQRSSGVWISCVLLFRSATCCADQLRAGV